MFLLHINIILYRTNPIPKLSNIKLLLFCAFSKQQIYPFLTVRRLRRVYWNIVHLRFKE